MKNDKNPSVDNLLGIRFRTNPDFLLREIGGEAVLIPLVSEGPLVNAVITLNDSGLWLWKQFETPRTIDEVLQQARAEFTDDGSMEQDIYEFVIAHRQAGLLIEEEL